MQIQNAAGKRIASATGITANRRHMSAGAIATAMLVASLVMAGFNGILASAISLPSFEIVLLRASLGAAILGIMLAASRKPLQVLRYKKEGLFLVLAGAALAADWLFLFEAYEYAGVGMSTILCYCAPIIVMVLSPVLFREKLTPVKVAGFAVVVAGAMLVNGVALQGGASIHGILCGLASAACFAAMMILNKKVEHVGGVEKVFVEIAASAVVVCVYVVFAKGITLDAVFSVANLTALPVAALGVSTALGNYLYLKAMGSLSVQSVAVLGYIEPLSAVALSAVVLGEALLPLQLAGAAFIILGALASELQGARASKKAAA